MLAAVAASGGTPALAADGDPLVLGAQNSAVAPTELSVPDLGGSGILVTADFLALAGYGTGDSGIGVQATGTFAGVDASSTDGHGVYASADTDSAVFGTSSSSNGVEGRSFSSAASGVYGENDSTGYGVAGRATNGVGVFADSANGTALLVQGKATFSRSELTTVPAGAQFVKVTGIALTTTSYVLVTVQARAPNITIQGVVTNVAHNRFTIWLTAPAPAATPIPVAWLVIG